jgi:ribosomal-protein-alanine N-acetyltransferase
VKLAPLQRRHLRAVMAIDAQVYPQPWSRRLFLAELARPETRYHVVALIGERVVGHGGLLIAATDAHITTVAVDPVVQRQGVARSIMVGLAGEAITREAQAMTLEVRASNTAAVGLYRAFGFIPAGLRRGYYPDEGEGAADAIVMWAEGIDTPEYIARLDGLAQRQGAAR